MAKVTAILQPLHPGDLHSKAIKELMQIDWADRFLISSAFVVKNGVETVSRELAKVSSKVTAYIGIRNGVTSVQGVLELLKTGITIYAIDTASSAIFHPKIYGAWNNQRARIIIGSSNMTFSGFYNNIEASAVIDLDFRDKDDENYLKKSKLFWKICLLSIQSMLLK